MEDTNLLKPYTVYEHTFPDGKRYIGITCCDPKKRWNNGNGYKAQNKMADAIARYGWDNIEHNVIVNGLTRSQASDIERYLINALDTIDGGYNSVHGSTHIETTRLCEFLSNKVREARKRGKDCVYYDCAQLVYDYRNDDWAELFNLITKNITGEFECFRRKNDTDDLLFWTRFKVELEKALGIEPNVIEALYG